MTAAVDSDRADEWGRPIKHELVFHEPSGTASCWCGRMQPTTADDVLDAEYIWQRHASGQPLRHRERGATA